MRKVSLTKRPDFSLLRMEDAVSFQYMQMPTWLFGDTRFQESSLEAKVVYTFLLHRFRLSKMNGWTNEQGEVFVIYPRDALAQEAGISYRKVITCFQELLAAGLIWEQRCGRGMANHIYFASISLENKAISNSTTVSSDQIMPGTDSQYIDNPAVEIQGSHPMICKNGMSRNAIPAVQDMPFLHSNKKDKIKRNYSRINKVCQCANDCTRNVTSTWYNDEQALTDILNNSELEVLPANEASVFRNAVTRLFYSNEYTVGKSTLPRQVIRSHLRLLDGAIVLDTREKVRANKTKQVRNSTAYMMTCLLNNICEYYSDVMVDPILNSM